MARNWDTHQDWLIWKDRKAARRAGIELFANVLASQIALLALLVQCYRGALSSYRWSDAAVSVILAVIAICSLALLIAPKVVAGWLGAALRFFGGIVINSMTRILLALVYILVQPVAYMYGRRRYANHHPQSAAWVVPRDWQVAGWVGKSIEADTGIHRRRSSVIRLLGYFAGQRNIFLLVIVVVLLLVVSVSALTHTPYLAPFVYTLF